VTAVAILSDGRVIVSDGERHLRVYSPNGMVLADLMMPVRIMSLRRDESRLVALPNCLGTPVPPLLIDLERYRVITQLDGHRGCVFSARWAAGPRIVTAGADGTARMWDGETGSPLRLYRGSARFLADAVLSSGMMIAGDADGLLRFWDSGSGAKLWTLPVHKSAVIGIHVEGGDIVTRGFTGEISRWTLPKPENVIDACGRQAACAIVAR
jgi:WD40 repeat protein